MKAHNQAWTITFSWHQCGISKPKSSHSTNPTRKTKVKAFTPHSSQRLLLELVGNLSLSFHDISSEFYKDFWSTVTSSNSTLKKKTFQQRVYCISYESGFVYLFPLTFLFTVLILLKYIKNASSYNTTLRKGWLQHFLKAEQVHFILGIYSNLESDTYKRKGSCYVECEIMLMNLKLRKCSQAFTYI